VRPIAIFAPAHDLLTGCPSETTNIDGVDNKQWQRTTFDSVNPVERERFTGVSRYNGEIERLLGDQYARRDRFRPP
jgi:hypothetical protein